MHIRQELVQKGRDQQESADRLHSQPSAQMMERLRKFALFAASLVMIATVFSDSKKSGAGLGAAFLLPIRCSFILCGDSRLGIALRKDEVLNMKRRTFLAASALVAAPALLPVVAGAQDATPEAQMGATPAASPIASPVAVVLPRYRALDFTAFDAALDALDPARIAELDALLPTATIPDLQNAMATGELTSEELTLYFLNRIRSYDDVLRSYIELNPAALDDAKAADAARVAGEPLGAMAGIPVSLKDNIETAGPMHTTAGAIVLADNVATQDAPLVASLKEAGAVILGKASLSEFAGAVNNPGANAMSGQGVNPFGAMFSTAGSSSGSSIATSALLTDVSVGSETSGSLIAPSAYNGVVGMKPSFGVVSGEGVVPLISFNDSAGPIGRWVTDVATLLGAIDTTETDYVAGLDAAPPPVKWQGSCGKTFSQPTLRRRNTLPTMRLSSNESTEAWPKPEQPLSMFRRPNSIQRPTRSSLDT